MASPGALKALIAALEAEQKRRRKAQFGGQDDPRQWFLDTLQAMAQRLTVVLPGRPLQLDDMSIAEKLACRWFLPAELQPAGLPSEDEIWAEYEARK